MCTCPAHACREIVKRIDMWGIDMVFVVGGNGGNAGANAINAMCQQHDVPCAVVGVPKSIDNDILLIDKVMMAGGGGGGWGCGV
jgi:6-phosphofructokinase 1